MQFKKRKNVYFYIERKRVLNIIMPVWAERT